MPLLFLTEVNPFNYIRNTFFCSTASITLIASILLISFGTVQGANSWFETQNQFVAQGQLNTYCIVNCPVSNDHQLFQNLYEEVIEEQNSLNHIGAFAFINTVVVFTDFPYSDNNFSDYDKDDFSFSGECLYIVFHKLKIPSQG